MNRADAFLALHRERSPLLMPNAWDAGSARLLVGLGFEAIATTSSGFAATLGRLDGAVTRDEALAHAAALSAAVEAPVSADLEDCFGAAPDEVARTVELAAQTGLSGCSVEDFSRDRDNPIYDLELAVERVAAAAEAAHRGPQRLVLTARAEGHLHGRTDLAETIARLRRYQEAGADVLFAPGVIARDDIAALVSELDRPINVLAMRGCPSVTELGELGVRRVSVGGAFAFAALGALAEAATELRERGTYEYLQRSKAGGEAARAAFRSTAG